MSRKLKDSTKTEAEEKQENQRMLFLLEQLADPKDHMPDCVSFLGNGGMEVTAAGSQPRALQRQSMDCEPWKADAPIKSMGLAANFEGKEEMKVRKYRLHHSRAGCLDFLSLHR